MKINRTKAEQIVDGLTYLLSIGKVYTCAEHDVFYAGLAENSLMTEEVIARMEALGWLKNLPDGFQIFT